jgi:hypothetical protein
LSSHSRHRSAQAAEGVDLPEPHPSRSAEEPRVILTMKWALYPATYVSAVQRSAGASGGAFPCRLRDAVPARSARSGATRRCRHVEPGGGSGDSRARWSFDRRLAVFMKPGRGPEQGVQIRHSGASGPLKPVSFAKLIRERPDQPVVAFSGAGKQDPEGQRAAFCGVSRLFLVPAEQHPCH